MLYRRGKKWWARGYFLDRKTGHRKRWRESTGVTDDGTARTKRIAEQIAAELGQRYATRASSRARPLTLRAAIAIHTAAHERAGSSRTTVQIVIDKGTRLMEFFGPTYDVSALTNRSLIDYADHRRLHPGRVSGRYITAGTIHRELRTLREALKDAIAENRWEGTVPDMPDLGDIYKPRETVIDQPQSQRVLLALAPQWRDHFVMYRQLGLDRGELYRIAPGDINWARSEVRIRGTKTEARDRVLPMPPEVAAILRERYRQKPMFPNWHNALRDLRIACEKAYVPRCNFKDLRRSFATDLAKAGVSPLFLKDLMGHTTTRMLEQVYARVGQGKHMHAAMEHVASLRGCAKDVPATALKAIGAESVGGLETQEKPRNSSEKPKSGG